MRTAYRHRPSQGEIGKSIVKDMLNEVSTPEPERQVSKPERESEIADDPLSPAGGG